MTDQDPAATLDSTIPRSRALVVLEGRRPRSGDERPQAVFLTQLIACERRLPAYRQARLASPDAATSAYARPAGPQSAQLNCLI